MSKLRKQYVIKVDESNPEKREITVIGSTLEIDRDKDLVDIKSMQLQNFKSNPVVLWSHRSGEPPIAKAINVTKTGGNTQLKFKLQFAKAEDYPFADTIFRLVKSGFINASSIGFSVDREKSEYDKERGGYNFHNSELLELSLCNVPANSGSLITQRSFQKALDENIINKEEYDEFLEKTDEPAIDLPEKPADDTEKPEQTLNELLEQLNNIQLTLNGLTEKVANLENNISKDVNPDAGLYDDLLDDIVNELDLGSEGSLETSQTVDDNTIDEILNETSINEE